MAALQVSLPQPCSPTDQLPTLSVGSESCIPVNAEPDSPQTQFDGSSLFSTNLEAAAERLTHIAYGPAAHQFTNREPRPRRTRIAPLGCTALCHCIQRNNQSVYRCSQYRRRLSIVACSPANSGRVTPPVTHCYAPSRGLWITRNRHRALWMKRTPQRLPYTSPMSPVVRGIINFSIGVISSTTEEAQKNTMTIKTGQRQSTKKSTPKPRSSSPSPTHSGSQHHYGGPAVSNRPQTSTREANITGALAHASYASIMGNDMDPGEAV